MHAQVGHDSGKAGRVWLSEDDCSLTEFSALVAQVTDPGACKNAASIEKNVPLYDCAALRARVAEAGARRDLMAEWATILLSGPGIIVLKGAFPDPAVVDRATAAFETIIAAERAGGVGGGDHFAKPGANDRVWNALEKLCLAEPEAFARYYGNDMIALVSESWLGPHYQVTSQVNVVNPGGEAQEAHRDYHLGFQTAEVAARYPAHVHAMSAALTLQGAVAHCDMPVESGPTKLLPFSQILADGYLAFRRSDFRGIFVQRSVQLPLQKGDAVFFSPALFHAAGANRTADLRRMANLLQISSAYGRAMETVDRTAMCKALFPVLQELADTGSLGPAETAAAVAACAEGYSFPTNLDRDPPVGGLAPQTQQALMEQALREGWRADQFVTALDEQARRKETS